EGPQLRLAVCVTPEPLRQCEEAVPWEAIPALMDDDNAKHSASCHILCKRDFSQQLAKCERIRLQAQAVYLAGQTIVGYCAFGTSCRRYHAVTRFTFSFLPISPINIVRLDHGFIAYRSPSQVVDSLRNRHSVFDPVARMQDHPICGVEARED